MGIKKTVVLVLCEPIDALFYQYPSIVMIPQTGEVPLGILYIASVLEKSGFNVVVINNAIEHLSEEQLVSTILSHSPFLVGFSLLVFNVIQTDRVASRLKELAPSTVIVYGGPHATIMPQKQADKNHVDLVITHQGEITLTRIAREIRDCGFSPFKKNTEKIYRGEAVTNLDALPFPARHLIDISKYRRRSYVLEIEPVDFLCSSRGCPFNCTFCSSKTVWDRRYYLRSAKSVVDEIEHLISNYGSQGIYFREDNFTVSSEHVLTICAEIKRRGIVIPWECESRVDTIDKKVLEKMREAGCRAIWCGVESGSQRILDKLKKGYSLEQVGSFCESCKDVGIDVGACFMLGFPSETIYDIEKTYNFAISLPVKWVLFATYVGFPGSQLFDEIRERNLWDASWEDILIARNEYFSSSELYELESAMNRDARKHLNGKESLTLNESGKNILSIRKVFSFFYLIVKHPFVFLKKITESGLSYLRKLRNTLFSSSDVTKKNTVQKLFDRHKKKCQQI